MTQIKKTLITAFITHSLLAASLLVSSTVSANSSQLVPPCETAETTNNGISLLSSECPIGHGLWAKMKPKHENSDFWLQCGVYRKGVSSKNLARIQLRVSEKVSVKLTKKGYQRCLVGPYKAYENAVGDMTALRKNRIFKDSFIREVKLSDVIVIEPQAKSVAAEATVAAVVVKPEPTIVAPASTEVLPEPQAKTEPDVVPSVEAVAVVAETEVVEVVEVIPVVEEIEVMEEKAVETVGNMEVRRQAVIDGRTYLVPFVSGEKERTYMEHELPWSREDFLSAAKICQSFDMALVTTEQWRVLRDSKRMEKESWPLQLPYWGENEQGMFMDGQATKLKSAALLNVVCVK